MAEGMLRGAASDWKELQVASAGLAAYGGGPASPETLQVLKERGWTLDGFRSRMVSDELVGQATHVFCMTRAHRDTLQSLYPDLADKFYLVCDFAEDREPGGDVPDPIGAGPEAYEQVAACLDQAIAGILKFLQAEEKQADARELE